MRQGNMFTANYGVGNITMRHG